MESEPMEMEQAEVVAIVADMTPEMMAEIELQAEQLEEQRQSLLSGLAMGINAKFIERMGRRQTKEREWIEAYRLWLGSLSTGRWQNGSKSNPLNDVVESNKPYHNLVRTKCWVAIAQGISSQFSGGDKNWDIMPTPVPENQEMAQAAADAMELEIEDQLNEENYGYKMRQAMQSRVVLGTGVLKGPVPARESKLGYQIFQNEDGTITTIPEYKIRNRPVVSYVDLWMCFPDDTVGSFADSPDMLELHPMSKLQVAKLKRNPGFFEDAIDSLLELDTESFANSTFSEYASLTDSGQNFLKNKYAVLEYHGPISVDELGALGIEPSYESIQGDQYYGEVWVCQGLVLRAELEPIAGLCQHPYHAGVWTRDPNSPFGFGLPLEIKDPQKIAQVTLDMILENASVSSGPIGIVNKAYIEPLDGDWTLAPHKLFGTTDYTLNSVDQAFKFVDIPNVTADLFPILNFAREVAQEESGNPALAANLQSPQATSDSATGLAIIQQNQTIVADFKNEEWDDQVVEPFIKAMYHWNMQFNPKPEIVGDFDIDVKSSSEYRNKQLFVRDVEKLSVEAAQNPALAKVLNMDALQKVRLSMMHIPTGDIIKTPEQIQQEEEAAAQNPPPPDPAMLKAEADMARIEVEKQKLQLEAQKMQFEMQFQQRREEMNHAERMGANYMRQLEAEARVMEAEANRQIELAKLAQKSESDKGWIMAELQKSILTDQTNKYMAGLDAQKNAQNAALKAAELAYATKTGKGI